MEGRRLFGGQRIVDEVGLSGPCAGALVDEGLDGGHGRGTDGGAAHSGDNHRAAAGEVGAVAGAGADGIEAVVVSIGRKQGEVGKVAHVVGGYAGSGLPGRLGVARRNTAGIERRAACSSSAGNDHFAGLKGRVAAVVKIEAEEIVPGLLGNGLLKRDGGRGGGTDGPVSAQLRIDGRGAAGVAAVVKGGAADGDVIRSGGQAGDRYPAVSYL